MANSDMAGINAVSASPPSRRGAARHLAASSPRVARECSILPPVSDSPPTLRPGFYEFFCGGGMARAGLGDGLALPVRQRFRSRQGARLRRQLGRGGVAPGRRGDADGADLPGRAELAWASFPCQDLSLAGAGAGLSGARSAAFWGFHALMRALAREDRAPRLIVLENVLRPVARPTAAAIFVALCRAVGELGYRFGALTIDAAHFMPQSRPRLFVVALDGTMSCRLPS